MLKKERLNETYRCENEDYLDDVDWSGEIELTEMDKTTFGM